MRLKEAVRNLAQAQRDRAEMCDSQASAGLKIIDVRARPESHEGLLLEPHHDVKKFKITLPTFIEIL